ncbi:MAG TPA: HAD-IC family P-type ATPase [Polyangiaceae bacterium]
MAVLESGFRYFCNAACKHAYLRSRGRPLEEDVVTARPPAVAPAHEGNGGGESSRSRGANGTHGANGNALSHARPRMPTPVSASFHTEIRTAESSEEDDAGTAPIRATLHSPVAAPAAPRLASVRPDRRVEGVLPVVDAVGIAAGALVPLVGLLGATAELARIPLTAISLAMLLVRLAVGRRDPADPHVAVVLGPVLGAVAATAWSAAVHDAHAAAIAVMAGLACATAIVVEALVARARVRVVAARHRIEGAFELRARAVHGEDTVDMPSTEVRPGEQILVEAGEVVGVDATVTAGEARVVPWLDATVEVTKREGDSVVAGARVLSSRLKMMTTWSGRERAWVKLLASPGARVDVAAPTPMGLRLVVERGTLIAAALVGLATFAANGSPVQILAAMSAGAVAFGAKALVCIVGAHYARAHLEALASGILYKDARSFERAAATTAVVLSARGTVLLGEPEIVAVEPLGGADVERILALAAGAETASTHPFAAAILRAARARGVAPDHVRNANVRDGLGVTAFASTGERLVVGGRAIMLEEKIGVAVTDTRASELEAQGRSVLLVAVGDRLLGLVALQDGLRQGARAAVQRLLDAGLEPVLMSGEARDTCESIGRSLDIEHLRPEVLPADRGAEVRALSEGGSVVAVIGHPVGDDGALGAADVAVAMNAAGSTPGEWAVSLASDDVRDAATALAIPHAARDRARVAIALGATPSLVALLAIGFGIAPAAVGPLAALVAALAVAVHARDAGGS